VRRLALLLALIAATAGGSTARAGCSPTHEPQDAGPRWSPDGSRIAFYRVLPGCTPAPVAIYVVQARGGAPWRIGMTNGQWPPAWAPDGTRLAFGSRRGLVVASDRLVELTRGPDFAPAWSPDGALISFRRGPPPASELWVVRPDGSGARRLAGRLHDLTLPVWSSDSRELAFAAYNGASADIHVVDVATGAVRVVAPSPAHDLEPAWGPADSLMFSSERDGQPFVYVAERDGSRVLRWVEGRHPASAPRAPANAYVRPDGIWVETGPTAPHPVVARDDVLGRVDWRPGSTIPGRDLPEFAFVVGGRCGRYAIYLYGAEGGRRLTNPCEFRGRGLVRGTPFRDFVYGSPGRDRLLGLGRADTLDGGAGDDVLDGDGGWDTLNGGPGADLLIGRGDPDTIHAGPGRDRVFGGLENDTIDTRDGWRDRIDCGGGRRDVVLADADTDVVAGNCERVIRR
jgi:dipeptidyl aminopeptidase/acylaminoacyl peptidase